MIYVRWYVVCLKKYFEKHFYNRLEYGRLENSPHKYIFDIFHSNLVCVCCFFPCCFVHFVSTHSVLPSRMLLGCIMPASKTNVILLISLELFLGWYRQPIFVGGSSSFAYARRVGLARESTFPDTFVVISLSCKLWIFLKKQAH